MLVLCANIHVLRSGMDNSLGIAKCSAGELCRLAHAGYDTHALAFVPMQEESKHSCATPLLTATNSIESLLVRPKSWSQ